MNRAAPQGSDGNPQGGSVAESEFREGIWSFDDGPQIKAREVK
jgi:hypothetical protein